MPYSRNFKRIIQRALQQQGQRIASKAITMAGRNIYSAGKKYWNSRGKTTSGTKSTVVVVGKGMKGMKRTRKVTKQKAVKKIAIAVEKHLGLAPVIGKYYKVYCGQALIGGTSNVNWKVADQLYRRAASTTSTIRPLAFFRVRDFVDAASVLFNNKSPATDGTLSSTNDFTDKELHFHVKSATYKIFFKNCTDQPLELQVITASPKDLEDDTFLDDWADQYSNINVVGAVTPSPTIWNTEPGHIDGLKKRWTYTTKKIILNCGQSYTMTKSLNDFDFKKIEYYDSNVLKKYGRMTSLVSYRYNVLPTVHYAQTGSKLLTGRCYKNGDPAVDQVAVTGLLVECNENYIINPPDTTTVTNKKDVICYHNDYDLTGNTVNKTNQYAKMYVLQENPVMGVTI